MLAFDASSMLLAWDDYSPENFPPLWDWLDHMVETNEIVISEVALREISNISPDCWRRLSDNGITVLPVTQEVLQASLHIKSLLGIVGENYHPHGVGENDIIIVATSFVNGIELVSNEAAQKDLPLDMRKYKIPATCQLPDVGVSCINFVRYFKRANKVFG